MTRNILFLSIFIFVATSCSILSNGRISSENDIDSADRIRIEFTHSRAEERRSPLTRIEQTIVKSEKQEDSFTFYDVITLDPKSFDLKDFVYVIIDDSSYPCEIQSYKSIYPTTSFNNKNSMDAAVEIDNLKILSDISNDIKKQINIEYQVDLDTMRKIKSADKIFFRYHAGPRMITVKVSGYKLSKLKEFIS